MDSSRAAPPDVSETGGTKPVMTTIPDDHSRPQDTTHVEPAPQGENGQTQATGKQNGSPTPSLKSRSSFTEGEL